MGPWPTSDTSFMNALGGRTRAATLPSHWEGIKDIPEITWTRGLVPAQLTALPSYSYGEESLQIEGRWLEPFPDQSPELVYGTDASGGVFPQTPVCGLCPGQLL